MEARLLMKKTGAPDGTPVLKCFVDSITSPLATFQNDNAFYHPGRFRHPDAEGGRI